MTIYFYISKNSLYLYLRFAKALPAERMYSQISRSFVNLSLCNYVIHFPSGYKFTLRVPQEITIKEITEIMKNYTALHMSYGKVLNGKILEPLFLASLENDFIADLYLSDWNQCYSEMSPLSTTDFRIVYSESMSTRYKNPAANQIFNFLGKLNFVYEPQNNEFKFDNFVVRNRKNGKMCKITAFPKPHLSFSEFYQIVSMRNYYMKYSHDRLFMELSSCFETYKSLCIVSKLYPFQLNKIKINNRFLLYSILAQIAKIIHVTLMEGVDFGRILAEDFWVDFELKVHYCGTRSFKKAPKDSKCPSPVKQCISNDESPISDFGFLMMPLVYKIFLNCSAKLLESYLPILHWFSTERITTYLDFLKYLQAPLEDSGSRKKLALETLIKSYCFGPLEQIKDSYLLEFYTPYIPRTSCFFIGDIRTNCAGKSQCSKNDTHLQEISREVSTIKKKKCYPFYVKAKPLYLARYLLKCKKNRNKTKNKSYLAHQLNKSKKHKKRVSYFLIDD